MSGLKPGPISKAGTTAYKQKHGRKSQVKVNTAGMFPSEGLERFQVEGGQGGDELLGLEGDGDDLGDEAEDVALVAGAVGVVDDAGAGVGGDAVLVDDPVEGGAVAEAVVEDGGRDAAEGEGFVVAELGLVFGEGHLLDAQGPGLAGLLDLFEGVFRLLLVVDVEFHEALACRGEGGDVGWEGDAGEFALEVGGVAGAVLRVSSLSSQEEKSNVLLDTSVAHEFAS